MDSKKELRKYYLDKRSNLSEGKIIERSKSITNKVDQYINQNDYCKVMIFVSFNNEIKTHQLIKKWLKEDKDLYLPYIDKDDNLMKICQINNFESDLKKGVYGILEPKKEIRSNNLKVNLDTVIVPGLVYDKKGYRIGYGGGYYDKFLSTLNSSVKKIGIVYSDFIVDSLPKDHYDIPVDKIITDLKIINI